MQQNLPKMLHKAQDCQGIPVVLATRPLGQPARKRAGVQQNSGRTVARLPESKAAKVNAALLAIVCFIIAGQALLEGFNRYFPDGIQCLQNAPS